MDRNSHVEFHSKMKWIYVIANTLVEIHALNPLIQEALNGGKIARLNSTAHNKTKL